MSQAGLASTKNITPPVGTVLDIEGNDGVAVPPNASGVIFLLGSDTATFSSGNVSTAPNIVTYNSATNTESVAPTNAQYMTNYTSVNHAASPYTVLATDYYISCDPSAGTITINLPNAPITNRLFIIKDRTGNAAVNNITLTTPGGTVTIDGSTSYVINSNYQAVNLLFNGTSYEVY